MYAVVEVELNADFRRTHLSLRYSSDQDHVQSLRFPTPFTEVPYPGIRFYKWSPMATLTSSPFGGTRYPPAEWEARQG